MDFWIDDQKKELKTKRANISDIKEQNILENDYFVFDKKFQNFKIEPNQYITNKAISKLISDIDNILKELDNLSSIKDQSGEEYKKKKDDIQKHIDDINDRDSKINKLINWYEDSLNIQELEFNKDKYVRNSNKIIEDYNNRIEEIKSRKPEFLKDEKIESKIIGRKMCRTKWKDGKKSNSNIRNDPNNFIEIDDLINKINKI